MLRSRCFASRASGQSDGVAVPLRILAHKFFELTRVQSVSGSVALSDGARRAAAESHDERHANETFLAD